MYLLTLVEEPEGNPFTIASQTLEDLVQLIAESASLGYAILLEKAEENGEPVSTIAILENPDNRIQS